MKQYSSRAGIGASSILLIVVVLTLTLFAVLAFVQARSDAALTAKTASSTAAYYDADVRAQKRIAALDALLAGGGSLDGAEGIESLETGAYRFFIDSGDGHTLDVTLDIERLGSITSIPLLEIRR